MTVEGMAERAAGVLLHVTSVRGAYGHGDLGPSARKFIDFLARAGQRYWQMLPIHPVGAGDSPYSGRSAFAGNASLISIEDLVAENLIAPADLAEVSADMERPRAMEMRRLALNEAFVRFRERGSEFARDLAELRARARYWLEDYALFSAVSEAYGGTPWTSWDDDLARHMPAACDHALHLWSERIAFYEFEQLIFDRQWRALRAYARERGVRLIGDAPLYVAHQSADVWGHQRHFRLDERGHPSHVSGVPPDAFSASGQRWGTPLYRWKRLERNNFAFWRARIGRALEHFDIVRLDHFIGFARYWEIPADAEDATHGRWVRGPGAALFEALRDELRGRGLLHGNALPLIAEDLGCVSPGVRALREQFGLPGMRVLQFAFGHGGGSNEHLPHHHPRHCVAYTGTHDNDTIRGWFEARGVEPRGAARGQGEAGPCAVEECESERAAVIRYLQGPHARALEPPIHLALIRALFAGPARTVIVPMQDWLGLGSDARMNVPGRAEGNWGYRLAAEALSPELAARMRAFVETYGRGP